MKNTDADVMLGAYFLGPPATLAHPLDGQEDEVRIAAVERSADWVRAQYLSASDTFITYGATPAACSAADTQSLLDRLDRHRAPPCEPGRIDARVPSGSRTTSSRHRYRPRRLQNVLDR